MLTWFAPHFRVESVLDLSLEFFGERGLTGLLFDLDNTLLECQSSRLPPRVVSWLGELQAGGIRLCALTNARPRRPEALLETLGIPFVAAAFKPSPLGCHRALRILNLEPKRTALVGDQVFADVLAGRLAGLYTILVPPLSPVEPWFTRLKRAPERWILRYAKTPPSPLARPEAEHRRAS